MIDGIKLKRCKMTRKITFVVAMILILCLCGCSGPSTLPDEETASPSAELSATDTPTQTPEPTVEATPSAAESADGLAGRFEGDQYINEALGLSITIPEGWMFATEDEIATIYGQAKGMMEGITELPANSQGYLMICSQYKLQSVASNPNINMMVSNMYGTLSASMYDTLLPQFQSMYDTLYTQQLGAESVEVSGEPSVTINGQDYMYFSIVSQFGDTAMYQEQYLLSIDGYVVTFTFTYYQPEEKATMDTFIQGIAFTS